MKFKFTVIILILGMFFLNPLTVQAKVQLFDDELLEQIEESADACSEIAFTIYLSTFNRYKYSVNFEKGSIKLEVQGKGYKLNGVRDDFFSEPKIKEDNLKDKTGNEVKDDVIKYFREKVYRTIIPRNVRLSEAPSYGQAIVDYDPRSRGAEVYLELAKEVLSNG